MENSRPKLKLHGYGHITDKILLMILMEIVLQICKLVVSLIPIL